MHRQGNGEVSLTGITTDHSETSGEGMDLFARFAIVIEVIPKQKYVSNSIVEPKSV